MFRASRIIKGVSGRFLLVGCLTIAAFGCGPKEAEPAKVAVTPPSSPAPTTPEPAKTNEPAKTDWTVPPKNPNAPLEAQILLDPYVLGAPVTGRVVGYAEGQNLGTLILAICTSDEYRRAQGEGRPPIAMETKTVDLDRPDGNRFEFTTATESTGGLMIYPSDPDSKVKVLPAEARPRPGGPLDNAGTIDGVGTTGQGAPPDAINPALRGGF